MSEEPRLADDGAAPPAKDAGGGWRSGDLVLPLGRREGIAGLALGFVVAIALHALIFPAVGALSQVAKSDPRLKNRGAQLLKLSRNDLDKNRRVQLELRAPDEEKSEEEKKKEDEEANAPGQVVTLPPPEKEERPDMADYASEWDQRAERETRSRDQRQRAPNVTRRLQEGALAEVPPPPTSTSAPALPTDGRALTPQEASGPAGPGRATAGDSGTDTTDGSGERMFALEIPRQAAKDPLKLREDDDGTLKNREAIPEVAGNGDTARIAMGMRPTEMARKAGSGGSGDDSGQGLVGGGNGTAGVPSLEQLTPAAAELARISGAPANDWLPEVEDDAETRLNAWRWKHATFFNRIAEAIRREWQGGEVLSSNDPAGRVYGFEDRVTVLQVTLDRDGKVLDVNVAEPSGAVVLDDEAIRAFKDAGPFANPPPQLFKGGERFTFQFGFNVTYNRTNFDLNWRPN